MKGTISFSPKRWMYELLQELPNDLKLSRKSLKCLELIGKYSVGHPKNKFWQLCFKIAKNQLQNLPQKNLYYLISWIYLQYFVQGCIFKKKVRLGMYTYIDRLFFYSLGFLLNCWCVRIGQEMQQPDNAKCTPDKVRSCYFWVWTTLAWLTSMEPTEPS